MWGEDMREGMWGEGMRGEDMRQGIGGATRAYGAPPGHTGRRRSSRHM